VKHRKMSWSIAVASSLAALLMMARAARAQESGIPKEVAEEGRRAYLQNCATCHGQSAKGDGPMAALLTIKPPDLTQLARKSRGTFHFWKVYGSVYGNVPKAHGGAMPVWGSEFQWEKGGPGARERVLQLVFYLQSIQEM
jgi:mono/diheme cytochrome c family protein